MNLDPKITYLVSDMTGQQHELSADIIKDISEKDTGRKDSTCPVET